MKKILSIALLFISVASFGQVNYFKGVQKINDTLKLEKQAQYQANYGSSFHSRSLIDKGYADSLHALALKQGSQSLSQNTSINLTGTYEFAFGNATKFKVDLTANGTDATGDLFYRGSDGYFKRLATGTSKQSLHPDGSGGYVWKDTTAVPTVTNPVQILYSGYTDVGNITTGEDDLMSFTVPANTLVTDGDWLEVNAQFLYASNGNAKNLRFYFGGTTLFNNATQGGVNIHIIITRTSSTTQKIEWTTIPLNGTIQTGMSTGTSTLSGTEVLKFTGDATATDDIKQQTMKVTYYHYTP